MECFRYFILILYTISSYALVEIQPVQIISLGFVPTAIYYDKTENSLYSYINQKGLYKFEKDTKNKGQFKSNGSKLETEDNQVVQMQNVDGEIEFFDYYFYWKMDHGAVNQMYNNETIYARYFQYLKEEDQLLIFNFYGRTYPYQAKTEIYNMNLEKVNQQEIPGISKDNIFPYFSQKRILIKEQIDNKTSVQDLSGINFTLAKYVSYEARTKYLKYKNNTDYDGGQRLYYEAIQETDHFITVVGSKKGILEVFNRTDLFHFKSIDLKDIYAIKHLTNDILTVSSQFDLKVIDVIHDDYKLLFYVILSSSPAISFSKENNRLFIGFYKQIHIYDIEVKCRELQEFTPQIITIPDDGETDGETDGEAKKKDGETDDGEYPLTIIVEKQIPFYECIICAKGGVCVFEEIEERDEDLLLAYRIVYFTLAVILVIVAFVTLFKVKEESGKNKVISVGPKVIQMETIEDPPVQVIDV